MHGISMSATLLYMCKINIRSVIDINRLWSGIGKAQDSHIGTFLCKWQHLFTVTTMFTNKTETFWYSDSHTAWLINYCFKQQQNCQLSCWVDVSGIKNYHQHLHTRTAHLHGWQHRYIQWQQLIQCSNSKYINPLRTVRFLKIRFCNN